MWVAINNPHPAGKKAQEQQETTSHGAWAYGSSEVCDASSSAYCASSLRPLYGPLGKMMGCARSDSKPVDAREWPWKAESSIISFPGEFHFQMARLSNAEHRSKSLASILSAAEYLFVTRGYNATTTADIGTLAGLTKGAVYFYFSDKEAVLLELLAGVQEVVMVPLKSLLGDKRLLPSERISAFLAFGGSLSKESPGSMLLPIVVSIEFAGSNTIVENRVKAGYRTVRNGIREVLALGQELGEFRTDVSADELSRALIATNDGLMLECLRNDLNLHVDRLVSTLNSVLLAGIAHSANANQHSMPPLESGETRSVIEVLRSGLPILKDKSRKNQIKT